MSDTKLIAVATPEVGGVVLRRHLLDRETAGLAKLAQNVGRRLRTWIRTMPDVHATRIVGRDETGRNIEEPIVDAAGNPVVMPWLPDSEWRENYDLAQKIIVALLKEQRERAKLTTKNGAPVVSDEVFEAQLKELAVSAIREMPRDELERLLAEKAK